jgi:OPA family sugar phosphate sensor protein UhpC-like MFS transporter
LGDRVHLGRFFASGLLLSALANLLFGVADSYLLFVALWGLNGWFQSVGAACSGVSLASWFPPRELGTRYALWSLSHNLGEGLTFGGTALLVGALGWRWGFLGPGLLCALAGLVLLGSMADRPAALGLPAANEPAQGEDGASVWQLQRAVLRTPMVWVLGLASALLYVARYAINNWGMLYLQDDRGYTLVEAGFAISLVPLGGALGTVTSGVVSDRLFAARRGPVSLAYGGLLVVSLAALLFLPPGHRVLVAAALGAVGFAVGGQMVFLGGLAAIDLCSKRASGAVMGVVGLLSYVGAAGQDLLSGALLHRRAGAQGYDFGQVKLLWLGAACLSLLLVLPLLRAERRA